MLLERRRRVLVELEPAPPAVLDREVEGDELEAARQGLRQGVDALRELGSNAVSQELDDAVDLHRVGRDLETFGAESVSGDLPSKNEREGDRDDLRAPN